MALRPETRSKIPSLLGVLVVASAAAWVTWAYGGQAHLTARGEIVTDTFDGVVVRDLQTHELRTVTFEKIERPRLSEVNPGPQRGYLVSGIEYGLSPYVWKSRAYRFDPQGRLIGEWKGSSAVHIAQSDKIAYLVPGADNTWRTWDVMVSEAENPGTRPSKCGQRGFPVGPEDFDPWRQDRFFPRGLVPCGKARVCFLSPLGTVDACDTTTLEVRTGPAGVVCLPRAWLPDREQLLCETRDAQMRTFDPRTGDLHDLDHPIGGRPVYIEEDQVLVWAEIGLGRSLLREATTWVYLSLPSGTCRRVRFQASAPAFWRPAETG